MADKRWREASPSIETPGRSSALIDRLCACAARTRASPACRLGLLASAWSTSLSSCGSPKAFHQPAATGAIGVPVRPSDCGASAVARGSSTCGVTQPASASRAPASVPAIANRDGRIMKRCLWVRTL
ncbi:hypothetical protein [Hydrocarboniphaga effusa]|uniref:hypothetical protein n=1 Tax=Hydrocarboniphaga effusa TaxID=243629 RepID=UPI001ED91BC3|nr:hypothetical protein [Hydrocarboniphaga effusa]